MYLLPLVLTAIISSYAPDEVSELFTDGDIDIKKGFLETFGKKLVTENMINRAFTQGCLAARTWLIEIFGKANIPNHSITNVFGNNDITTKKWVAATFSHDRIDLDEFERIMGSSLTANLWAIGTFDNIGPFDPRRYPDSEVNVFFCRSDLQAKKRLVRKFGSAVFTKHTIRGSLSKDVEHMKWAFEAFGTDWPTPSDIDNCFHYAIGLDEMKIVVKTFGTKHISFDTAQLAHRLTRSQTAKQWIRETFTPHQ